MKKKIVQSLPFLLLFFVISLSIGYSALGTELLIGKIALNIRVEKEIRVTNLELENYTDGVLVSGEEYNTDLISFDVKLPEETSSITYKVQVTNIGSTEMGILDITGLPENLDYEITNYNLKDKICNQDGKCTLGAVKDFYITIKYKTNETYNGYDINNIDYNLILEFDFREIIKITYENIEDNNYPKETLKGTNLNITFKNNIPEGIYIKGEHTYTYNSPNLTVNNISSNITISNTVVYEHIGDYVFNGTNYIDTGVYLFNQENINRNFIVTLTIKNYNETQESYASIFNSMDEFNPDYPGVVFRVNKEMTNFELVANNKINNFLQAAEKFVYNTVNKVKIIRYNNKLYYSINDENYYEFQDYTVFNEYFEIPATFGASLDENGQPFRYFNGTLADMKIKFLDNISKEEIFEQKGTLNIAYINKESKAFDGTNYINTGIYLFNEENINKDFRIKFTITKYNETQENYATIVNSINETNKDYPGLLFRFSNDTTQYEFVANCGENKKTTKLELTDVTNVSIIRKSNIIYYSINYGEYIEHQDYTDFTQHFEIPVTFGASLDETGAPYRYFKGTLTNFEIDIKE